MMKRVMSKVFGAPHLPGGLAGLILALGLTQALVLLINQPVAYWQNARYAEPYLTLDFLLAGGPWLYAAGALFALLVIGLLLTRLNLRAGFFLAGLLFFFHSVVLFFAAPCGLTPLLELTSDTACSTSQYGFATLTSLLFFGLLFVRLPEKWARRAKVGALALGAAWFLLLGYGLFRAIRPVESVWRPIVPAHSPGKRAMAAVAYDTKRQRAVLFGGVAWFNGNDTVYDASTWEWDGQDWHEMKPAVSPPPRRLHAMAYDEKRGRVVMYGGQDQNGGLLADLWEWDGVNWTQMCPVCNPAGRFSHKMFYDPELEMVMLYGGSGQDKAFGEAWGWNGTCWGNLPFSTSAPGLLNSPLVYDPLNHRVIAYMKDEVWGGTWIWQEAAWNRLALPVQPPLRIEANMVYDPGSRETALFGGDVDGVGTKDTWIFDGTAWSELKTPLAPPHRSAGSAFYDPLRKSVVLYGGFNSNLVYEDMWELVIPGGNP
jgi:hypothetical protein